MFNRSFVVWFVPAAFPLLTSTTKKILALFICKIGQDTPEPFQAEKPSSLSPQSLHERCFMPLHSLMALSWTCSTITPLCSTWEPSTRPRTPHAAHQGSAERKDHPSAWWPWPPYAARMPLGWLMVTSCPRTPRAFPAKLLPACAGALG